ncbi:MAG TPA: molybdopterin-binding protein, partial [Verrucomicrobiae bacterium]|nr:molybdopterin-binding protein [Verrucomicrobiae bacterium]
ALLSPLACDVLSAPIVADSLAATVDALRAAFHEADLVLTSGGVSVGEFDYVKEAFHKIGGTVDLWRVAIRPGKPFVFGKFGEKFLFGLPGNPVSAFVTFLLLVRPAILHLQGASNLELPVVQGTLAEAVTNRGDRRHFIRVRFEANQIFTTGPQKSHMIGRLGQANGLLDLPAGAQWERGSTAPVHLWELPES